MPAFQTPDLPVDILKTQLNFAFWFIGILLSVIAFFIIRSFASQSKKDLEQDKQLEKLSETLEKMGEVAITMQKMLAGHDADIRWLIKGKLQ